MASRKPSAIIGTASRPGANAGMPWMVWLQMHQLTRPCPHPCTHPCCTARIASEVLYARIFLHANINLYIGSTHITCQAVHIYVHVTAKSSSAMPGYQPDFHAVCTDKCGASDMNTNTHVCFFLYITAHTTAEMEAHARQKNKRNTPVPRVPPGKERLPTYEMTSTCVCPSCICQAIHIPSTTPAP